METIRRSEKNRLELEVKQTRKVIEREEEIISRFQQDHKDVTKHCESLEHCEEKLSQVQERLRKLKQGELDTELQQERQRNQEEAARKRDTTLQRKAAAKQPQRQPITPKHQPRRMPNNRYNNNGKQKPKNQNTGVRLPPGYLYYNNVCNSIPDHIEKKLNNMPNNRGFIWRGVYCYGAQTAEKGKPIELRERKGNDIYHIHRWDENEYKIFRQEGRNRKCISVKSRRKKHKKATLADCVKK